MCRSCGDVLAKRQPGCELAPRLSFAAPDRWSAGGAGHRRDRVAPGVVADQAEAGARPRGQGAVPGRVRGRHGGPAGGHVRPPALGDRLAAGQRPGRLPALDRRVRGHRDVALEPAGPGPGDRVGRGAARAAPAATGSGGRRGCGRGGRPGGRGGGRRARRSGGGRRRGRPGGRGRRRAGGRPGRGGRRGGRGGGATARPGDRQLVAGEPAVRRVHVLLPRAAVTAAAGVEQQVRAGAARTGRLGVAADHRAAADRRPALDDRVVPDHRTAAHRAAVHPGQAIDPGVALDRPAVDRGPRPDVGGGGDAGRAGHPAPAVAVPVAAVGRGRLGVAGLVAGRDRPADPELVGVAVVLGEAVQEAVVVDGRRGAGDHQVHLLARLRLEAQLAVGVGAERAVARRAALHPDEAVRPARGRRAVGVALEVDPDRAAVAVGHQLDLVVAEIGRCQRVRDRVVAGRGVHLVHRNAVVRVQEARAVDVGDEPLEVALVAVVPGDLVLRVLTDLGAQLGLAEPLDPAVGLQRVLGVPGRVPDVVERLDARAVLVDDVLHQRPGPVVVPAAGVGQVLRPQEAAQVTRPGVRVDLHRHVLRAGLPERPGGGVGEPDPAAPAQEREGLEDVPEFVRQPPGAGRRRLRVDVDDPDLAVGRTAGGPGVQLGPVPGVRDDDVDLVLRHRPGLGRELHLVHVERVQRFQLGQDVVRVEVVRAGGRLRAGARLLAPEQDEVGRLLGPAARPRHLTGAGPGGRDVHRLGGRLAGRQHRYDDGCEHQRRDHRGRRPQCGPDLSTGHGQTLRFLGAIVITASRRARRRRFRTGPGHRGSASRPSSS